MSSFVKLSVQEIFPNIQYFRNSDGSICGSSPIGFGVTQNASQSNDMEFGATQNAGQSNDVDFSSLMDVFMDNYAKSFSKSTAPDETARAQAKYIIKSLDKDKNGTISINELNNFKNLNLDSNLENKLSNLKEQFKTYDLDRDGSLSLTEIDNAFSSKGYSAQELSKMAKEFRNSNSVSKDDKFIIQGSDII